MCFTGATLEKLQPFIGSMLPSYCHRMKQFYCNIMPVPSLVVIDLDEDVTKEEEVEQEDE